MFLAVLTSLTDALKIALPAMRVILRLKYRTSIKDYFQNGFPKIQRNVWDLK